SDYYLTRVFSSILCFLLVSICVFLSNYKLWVKICGLVYAFYYSLVILKEYFSANYQINKKYKNIFIYNCLSGFLSFLGFLVIYYLTNELFKALIGMVFSRFVCIILDHYMAEINLKRMYASFDIFKSLNLIKDNFFLGISAVLTSSLILIPR